MIGGLRQSGFLVVASTGVIALLLAAVDSSALPLGIVVLLLIAAAQLSHIYRYGDIAAAVFGGAAYLIVERGQGREGLLAWVVASFCFAGMVVVMHHLDRQIGRGEEARVRLQQLVEELTMFDDASGLLKRRYGELAIEEEVRRARRTGAPFSLVLLAPDPAPEHPVELPPDEDEEAALIGQTFRETLRVTDRLARLGPSIFAAILPATDAKGGGVVGEKLCGVCLERGSRPLRAGVATFPDNAVSTSDLMDEAHAALQLARSGGVDLISPTMLAN
jgi:GGDEF domain-containing protein